MLQFSEEAITNDANWTIVGSSKARIVSSTPHLDETCAYVARVSSKKQDNPSVSGLLRYCSKFGHWSVFEQGALTMEVVTPLAISIQLLRHRSFCFQQFSGRYQDQRALMEMTHGLEAVGDLFYLPPVLRTQDPKNRQNSIPQELGKETSVMWGAMEDAYVQAKKSYDKLIEHGVAKEVARFVLPQGVYTRLYVTGNARSFIHYCNVRDDAGVAQFEHVELAQAIRTVFTEQCPLISDAVWGDK
ncbi:MAG: FAD-dependent thymidylate synthase [Pirellulales bacterium]